MDVSIIGPASHVLWATLVNAWCLLGPALLVPILMILNDIIVIGNEKKQGG